MCERQRITNKLNKAPYLHVEEIHNLDRIHFLFVCVEVLRPSQPNGVMSSAVIYLTTRLLGRLSPLSG